MNLMKSYKTLFVGQDYKVPIINGNYNMYINLDNAATTPPFRCVIDKVNEFSEVYSSIHRGNGFKSMLTSDIYEQARYMALELINADTAKNTAVFTGNSTEAINLLARLVSMDKDDIVISTCMEHHSNDLPWRKLNNVKYIEITSDGELDIEHFIQLLHTYKSRIKLVSITAASNVTGNLNPIHQIARLTHEAGAYIMLDASQYIPHRFMDIKENDNIEHIDFVAYTSHKMYAPFGTGVLVGPKDFFNRKEPVNTGGGIVKMVTESEIIWDETPAKNEAGTPNVIGAVALATSIKQLHLLSYPSIDEYELNLTEHLLEGLRSMNGIKIFGFPKADINKRLGVVSFQVEGVPHALVSAILSYEYGIGVRNGCFCAHPYVLRLLGVTKKEVNEHRTSIMEGNKSHIPGLVRVSIGLENTHEEIDTLLYALKNITRGEYSRDYYIDYKTGVYTHKECNANYHDYFSF